MALVQRGVVSAKDVDLAVTSSLGLRWAVTGPLMTNTTIGRAGAAWIKDMNEHQFDGTNESLKIVDTSLQEWIGDVDFSHVEDIRDRVVMDIIDLKKKLD
ncbi:hypothetical protein F5Y03DRAFT_399292 [Xylaria venustula]|nr:hypothetical protein F5Y03DRAFT_399292 [Xylaria venustula]